MFDKMMVDELAAVVAVQTTQREKQTRLDISHLQ